MEFSNTRLRASHSVVFGIVLLPVPVSTIGFVTLKFKANEHPSSLSSLARQLLVCPGLLKKICPFVSVEGDFLPFLDL
jgi:hypothetical protein